MESSGNYKDHRLLPNNSLCFPGSAFKGKVGNQISIWGGCPRTDCRLGGDQNLGGGPRLRFPLMAQDSQFPHTYQGTERMLAATQELYL